MMREPDWVSARDLEYFAMKARHGWWRTIMATEVDRDIKIYYEQIADTILYNIGEGQDFICRLKFLRNFPL